MSLKDTIKKDQITAMKAKDKATLGTIRMLLSAIANEEIDKQEALTDEDIQKVAARTVKQLNDAIKDFDAGGRADAVEEARAEIAVLQNYLPAQLSDEELRPIVEKVIADTGASAPSDMGKVMGAVMKEVGSGADGNRVRTMVSELLAQ